MYHCSENCPIQEFSFSMLNSAAQSTVTCFVVGLFVCLFFLCTLSQGVWADKLFGDGTRRRISQHYHAHPQNRRKKIFLVANKEKQKQESVLVVPANSFLHRSEALNMESHLSRIKASIAFYILTTELAEREKKKKKKYQLL